MSSIPKHVRPSTPEAILDAAERLLVQAGHAGTTSRRVADAAGANQGLVHYHFGSMEELFVRVLERFTAKLVERQRELYGRAIPFREKWLRAMAYFEDDLAAGYPKVWFELQALAWNRPALRERLVRVDAEWREVLTTAFERARREYGLSHETFPVPALVALVMTFNQGMQLERLSDIDTGHRELLAWVDERLAGLERGARS